MDQSNTNATFFIGNTEYARNSANGVIRRLTPKALSKKQRRKLQISMNQGK